MLSTTDDTADTSDIADLVSVDSSGGDSVAFVKGTFFPSVDLFWWLQGTFRWLPLSPSLSRLTL